MIDIYPFKYAPSFCPPENEAEAEIMLDYHERLRTALRANMCRVDFLHNPSDFDELDNLYDSVVYEHECLKRYVEKMSTDEEFMNGKSNGNELPF